jgi:hypothetical protein
MRFLLIGFFLTTGATVWAQTATYQFQGYIVNARCMQAAAIVNRNSRGYELPRGVSAFQSRPTQPINTLRMRKAILRHCSLNPGVTEFALLNEAGNFFKLDDTGNSKVIAVTPSRARKVKAIVNGKIDRETLRVVTLELE